MVFLEKARENIDGSLCSNLNFSEPLCSSASACFVVKTLRSLPRDGRTVIASIHQLSREVFSCCFITSPCFLVGRPFSLEEERRQMRYIILIDPILDF